MWQTVLWEFVATKAPESVEFKAVWGWGEFSTVCSFLAFR